MSFQTVTYINVKQMVVFPNAKINIGLDITARRPDNYHDICSVLYPVPWRDILEIVPAAGETTTLTVTGRGVACPTHKNLVMKAYNALDAHVHLPPVDIFLHKIIPDGAGLGGGSADAAFTLLALDRLFDLRLGADALADIAATLGADCPFFIYNEPMLATGTGTTLTPINISLTGYGIIIIKPQVSIPTAEAYAGVVPAIPDASLPDIIGATPPAGWKSSVKNDFEPTVFNRHPSIAGLKQRLYTEGAIYSSMSGSGSAVYGIFDTGYDNLADILRETYPDCDIFTGALD